MPKHHDHQINESVCALPRAKPAPTAAIMPGDILVGDADGLVVIRPEDAKEVAEKALKQNEAERNLLKIIDEGKWDRSNFAVTLEKMGCEIID